MIGGSHDGLVLVVKDADDKISQFDMIAPDIEVDQIEASPNERAKADITIRCKVDASFVQLMVPTWLRGKIKSYCMPRINCIRMSESGLRDVDMIGLPAIKRVIFNYPATIILWDDGTKSVVKCQREDVYDTEKGIMACMLKRFMGNDNTFNKVLNRWVKEDV